MAPPIEDDHYVRQSHDPAKRTVFICSICHTITELLIPDYLNKEIRDHRSRHALNPRHLGTVTVLLDTRDDGEPYLGDLMSWRTQYYTFRKEIEDAPEQSTEGPS